MNGRSSEAARVARISEGVSHEHRPMKRALRAKNEQVTFERQVGLHTRDVVPPSTPWSGILRARACRRVDVKQETLR